MIDYLYDVEMRLAELLKSLDGWQTRHVTYETPFVERLFRQDGANRIYLHRIHRCKPGTAYYHIHPWPSAMRVLAGSYEMKLGIGDKLAATLWLPENSMYEMLDPEAKHSVQPLSKTTLSLMVTGPAWAKSTAAQRANPELDPTKAQRLLRDFQSFYPVRT